jgi:type VI secretion system secreted protein VgrG
LTINGTNHGGDTVTQGAESDLTNAYSVAVADSPATPLVAGLGGQTLGPGVYNSTSSIDLTGVLTLDGGGDPNANFVFQTGSMLTTATASRVNLTNGAQSCNVYWQVGSSTTLGTDSMFNGTVLATTDITVTTGTSIDGRLLSVNGAVTLDTATITTPDCVTTPTTTTPNVVPATGKPAGGKAAVIEPAEGTTAVTRVPGTLSASKTPAPATTVPTATTSPSINSGGAIVKSPTPKAAKRTASPCPHRTSVALRQGGPISTTSCRRTRTSTATETAERTAFECGAVPALDLTGAFVVGGLMIISGASLLGILLVRRRRRLTV